MNKKVKILSVMAIIVVTLFLFNKWFFNQPCLPPDRPTELTDKALWFGGCDGGNWIELVGINTKENKYRFRIYRDYNGSLVMDADFKMVNCEKTDILNENNWSNLLVSYLNENIGVKGVECYLEVINPPYETEE